MNLLSKYHMNSKTISNYLTLKIKINNSSTNKLLFIISDI